MLASEKVVNVIKKGHGKFEHGQTYEGMPSSAVAALEVLKIIKEEKLLDNASKQGAYLRERLDAVLSNHPNVGNIRGRGLLLSIEFVENKETKKPFNPKLGIAKKIYDLAASPKFNVLFYHGGDAGYHIHIDRIIIAPPLIIQEKEVDRIVEVLSEVIQIVFKEVDTKKR